MSVPKVITVESTLHLNYSGCFPLLLCSLFRKTATGPDSLKYKGVCFPLLIPFEEHWQRVHGTNGFHKVGDPDPANVDLHSSASCYCNRIACGMKVC